MGSLSINTGSQAKRCFSIRVHRVPGTSTIGYVLNEKLIEVDDLPAQKAEDSNSASTVQDTQVNCLIIVLDVSGSMAGAALTTAKQAIEALLTEGGSTGFKIFDSYEHVQFITFDHTIPLNVSLGPADFKQVINGVKAGGSTDFALPLNEVLQHLNNWAGKNENKSVRAQVVFFTDGCHNTASRPDNVLNQIGVWANQESTKGSSTCAFHCVGFTSSHDVAFIQKIVNGGNEQGSFQYAENAASIPTCVSVLHEVLLDVGTTVSCRVICDFSGGTANDSVDLVQSNRVGELAIVDLPVSFEGMDQEKASELMVDYLQEHLIIRPTGKDDSFTASSPLEVTLESFLDAQLSIEIFSMEKTILALAKKLQEDKAVLNVHVLAALDQRLTEIIVRDPRFRKYLDKDLKSKVFDRVKGLKDLISELYRLSNKLKKKQRVDQHELAKLMSSSYDFVTKRHLQKQLDKKVQKNIDGNLFKKIEDAKAKHTFSESFQRLQTLESLTPTTPCEQEDKTKLVQSLETFKCMLSTSNWMELVKERKSIGFGLRLGRSQAAIADPSQLRIFEVCPTMMSIDSFFSSVEYQLGQLALEEDDVEALAQLNITTPSPGDLKNTTPVNVVASSAISSTSVSTQIAQKNIHGGFGARTSAEAGSVVEGVARELINGLMPLFIHEDHWKMAKEDASPLFGWMTTLDVFGASSDQLFTIPLVVLTSFLQQEKKWSQIDAVLFLQLWRTCRAIVLDMAQGRNATLPDYNVPGNRTPDKISSNNVLLAKLLVRGPVASEDGSLLVEFGALMDTTKPTMTLREFLEAVFEEEVRRFSKGLADDYDKKVLVPKLSCSKLAQMRPGHTPDQLWSLANPTSNNEEEITPVEECATSNQLGCHVKTGGEAVFELVERPAVDTNGVFGEVKQRVGRFPAILANFTKLLNFFHSLPMSQKELVKALDKSFGIAGDSVVQALLKVVNGINVEDESGSQAPRAPPVEPTLDLFGWEDATGVMKECLPTPFTSLQAQGLIVQAFAHRVHGIRREASEKGTVLNFRTESQAVVEDFVSKQLKSQVAEIENSCRKAWQFANRFERMDVETFLSKHSDVFSKVKWIQDPKNKELLAGTVFYRVNTYGTSSVSNRASIMAVDTWSVLKEMKFECTNAKSLIVVVPGPHHVEVSTLGSSLVSSQGRTPSVYFDSCFQSLGCPFYTTSIPFWIVAAYPQQFSGLILDKSLVEVKEDEPFYGASGVTDVIAAYPPSVFKRFLKAHQKDKDKKGKSAAAGDATSSPVVVATSVRRY